MFSDEVRDLTDQLAECSRRVIDMEKVIKRHEVEKEEILVRLEDAQLAVQQEMGKTQRAIGDINTLKTENERRIAEKEEEIDNIR